MPDTSVVARVPTSIEAELIVGMLQSNGIGAWVSADDAGGLEPQFQLTSGVRVLVTDADAAEAYKLIRTSDL
jgi:hypothetical protein